MRRSHLAGIVLGFVFGVSTAARAESPQSCPVPEKEQPTCNSGRSEKCPKPSYCCLHYWTPSWYVFKAEHARQPHYQFEISDPSVIGYRFSSFRCPAVESGVMANLAAEVGMRK